MLFSRMLLVAAAFAALGAAAVAAPNAIIVVPQTAVWQPSPIRGTQMSPVVGNPNKPGGYYAYLLKIHGGTRVPVHFHRMTEMVNVISGAVMFGTGDVMNPAKMVTLTAGSIISVPGGVHHYAFAKTDSIIEVSGIGPDTITYVRR